MTPGMEKKGKLSELKADEFMKFDPGRDLRLCGLFCRFAQVDLRWIA